MTCKIILIAHKNETNKNKLEEKYINKRFITIWAKLRRNAIKYHYQKIV